MGVMSLLLSVAMSGVQDSDVAERIARRVDEAFKEWSQKVSTDVANLVREELKKALTKPSTTKPVTPTPPPKKQAYIGFTPDTEFKGPGVKVTVVKKDMPADKAGMKEGDIMTKFGERKIENLDDFREEIRKSAPGDKVKVVIKRGEEEMELEVEVIARP